MFKKDDKVMTSKGIGIIVSIDDNNVNVFINNIASSDFPDVPSSFIHKFNIKNIELYLADGANRWYW